MTNVCVRLIKQTEKTLWNASETCASFIPDLAREIEYRDHSSLTACFEWLHMLPFYFVLVSSAPLLSSPATNQRTSPTCSSNLFQTSASCKTKHLVCILIHQKEMSEEGGG
jgi:hypothetical protein